MKKQTQSEGVHENLLLIGWTVVNNIGDLLWCPNLVGSLFYGLSESGLFCEVLLESGFSSVYDCVRSGYADEDDYAETFEDEQRGAFAEDGDGVGSPTQI